MEVKKSFTLIEAILVIIILSFITIGGFQIISKIYERNFIATKMSEFSFKSQQVLDQLSGFLYYRIPLTAIGYDPKSGDFKYIGNIITEKKYKIFEWIGECSECKRELNLSGFLDLYKSDLNDKKVFAKDFNINFINDVLHNKFGTNIQDGVGIIFAGSFDRGEENALINYKNSFGWHRHQHKYIATIISTTQDNNDAYIKINYSGKRVYEKFYLVDSAYAIAIGKDIDQNSKCIKDLHLDTKTLNNTLLLFYNYRPWKNETFCADNRGNPEGNVTLLAKNVDAFKIRAIGAHLELLLEMKQQKEKLIINVSKQKVTF